MKQYITNDQLNELSYEQWEKIKEILNVRIVPFLSIGQLIECLKEKDPGRLCEVMTSLFRGGYIFPGKNQTFVPNRCKPEELVDALFEAVKSIL